MSLRIALAPGDGIGPEIMEATLMVLHEMGVGQHVTFVPVEMGKAVFDRGESRGMTEAACRTVEECGLVLKGPMETPKGGGGKSINVSLRKMYGAFANLRHFRTLPGVETVYSRAGVNVNFYIVRENIEDTYGGIEHRLTNDVIECKRLISAPGCDQVSRFAFETARASGITKVHCGHKANIMKMTDGLFLERFRVIGQDYREIEIADVIVDALCMNLVIRPQQYQMIVLPNLQGDIVSDLAAGLVGGLGFAPSANIGQQVSIFEAVHGTAPDIAGKGIANPTSLLLSSLMMLRHIGLLKQAAMLENAMLATLESGVRTGDFGNPAKEPVGTAAFAKAIISHLGKAPSSVSPVPVPEQDVPTFVRQARPLNNPMLRTFTQVVNRVVGCDVYIDATHGPTEIATILGSLAEPSPFRLTMISNRGTQVWPTGSVYTECVDYYRVRFELKPGMAEKVLGQAPAIALLGRIAERFFVTDFQVLREFDGRPGYSLAQGQ
ncbi:MAG: NADP-dependent isocitrate dehydrogenase [Phycisphaeraceae bacterium]|nr:NADP-dependent isocitrate dehydrogenase [Phycisphaeraceae bacterium]MCW5754630.1 NADP-dependent isocitrate dehydrogenase [Phycisphaeraceae bacterium]